jgi:hypothetical protein
VDYGGEVHQEGVAYGLDNRTLVLSHGLLDELVMGFQQPQHAASLAPIWRLKPTMSVNMMAASLRVSA